MTDPAPTTPAPAPAPAPGQEGPPRPVSRSQVKETATSVLIAFALAFVFKGFVMEAFEIPTGSMAPTLMGQHARITGPETGFNWPYGPHPDPQTMRAPPRVSNLSVRDPMTGPERQPLLIPEARTRSGDRIFVLKYLEGVFGPERWDNIVFKNPTVPAENYIKRLVGLPGEEVALADGDVFVRPAPVAGQPGAGPVSDWDDPAWRIVRKPERVQRQVWQPVFDSAYTPLSARRGENRFTPPWVPSGQGWTVRDVAEYRFEGSGATALEWNSRRWPITDDEPYNPARNFPPVYPVSDIRVSLTLEPAASGVGAALVLATRGREFRLALNADGAVTIASRPAGDPDAAWTEAARGSVPATLPGRSVRVEFWHADQALRVWVDDRLAASAEYELTPAERLEAATGRSGPELFTLPAGAATGQQLFPLENASTYREAGVRLEFTGGPLLVRRVALDRDLHYTPAVVRSARDSFPGRGTHPLFPAVLGPDQFFTCGDNSSASLDSRLMGESDPWVASEFDPAEGLIHRRLLIGRAFFVYFPAPAWRGGIPVPDVGRMRWLW